MFETNEKEQKINILYNYNALIAKYPFYDMYFLPYGDKSAFLGQKVQGFVETLQIMTFQNYW